MPGKDQQPIVVDEMFPDLYAQNYMEIDEITTNTNMEFSGLQPNDKCVHSDFYNKFDDLFDDDDLD